MKVFKSITNCYNKLSNFGKILIFIAILLIIVIFFKNLIPVKEGMIDQNNFLFKQGDAVYDDFYADVYDYLVFKNYHPKNQNLFANHSHHLKLDFQFEQ